MIWLWLLLAKSIHSQSPCNRGQVGQLATVAVWVKHNDSLTTFRISDEDLTDDGFQKSPADRDVFQVQLGRQPGSCPVGLCALRLSTSKRKKDGVFLQQEDIYTLPEGYENLQDDFYCGRALGDCGADVPIYRLTRGKGPDAIPAYSIDSTASLPGFSRDPRPICYGWSDETGMRRPVSGDGCLKQPSVANGQITYSVEETSSLAVGTTSTLHCSSGYLSTGPSSALCTRSGWNPRDLGSCVKSNGSLTLLSTGSTKDSASCTAAATVKNGQIIYSQLEHSGKLPSGTTASVLCYLGYVATATSSPKCDNGDWIGQWPSCVSAEKVQCQPMATPAGSKIAYEPSENPLAIGSTATLSCPSGSAIAGATRSTCGKSGWQPKSLGLCVSSKRVKRQGLPCLALAVLGGTPSYIQANPSAPYAAGTSVIITCNAGYILQGSGSSVCSNGQWSPAPGTCILSSTGLLPGGINSGSTGAACPDLLAPFPGSGSITYSLPAATLGTHPSATVATLTCSLGTTVSGSLSSTCTSGVWSPPTLGSCVASTIGGIGGVPGIGSNNLLECANPVVINGQITYSTSSALEPVKPTGSTATLTCNGGFIISGTALATCQSGIWSPPLGTCNPTIGSIGSPGTGSCFVGVTPPLGATVAYSNGALIGPWPSGTTARLTCPGGGVPSGSIQATCSNGQWTPSTLACSSSTGTGGTTCPAVITPSGGNVVYSQLANFGSYNSGTTATLTCQSGTLLGSATASCQNGIWSPTLGTCSGGIGGIGTGSGTCNMLIPPMGTTVSYSAQGPFGPFNVGTTARITCLDPNQQFIGNSVVTCSSGQWTPSIASSSCAPSGTVSNTQCPFGVSPPFGSTVTYSTGSSFGPFPANTIATMQCTSGFIQGQSTSSCVNGQWSPQLGTCSGSGSTGTQCFAAVTVPSGGTVSYSGGQIFAPFSVNTIATLTCNTGFVQGLSTASCSNGQWTQLGTCSGSGTSGSQCFVAVTVPSGGTVSYSGGQIFAPFSANTIATLTCMTGFVQGLSTATCSNGQWTQLGTCSGSGTGSSCPAGINTPIGGTVTFSNGAIFGPFPSGTTATLRCTTGTATGSSFSTCSNGVWNPSTFSTCSSTGTGSQCFTAVPTPSGGTISYSGGQIFAPFSANTIATLTCTTGIVQGLSTASCSDGQWTQLGTCSTGGTGGTSCSFGVGTPIGGTISYSNGQTFGPWPSGTTAILTCSGSLPVGASTSICSNGQWTQLGTCSGSGTGGSQCFAAVTVPSGGTVSYSGGQIYAPFSANTVATLTCTTGFVQGLSTATCSNGQWTQLGTCSGSGTGSSCPAGINTPIGGTVTFSNGAIFGPFPSGTTATLRCTTGTATGSSFSTCSNGVWNPSTFSTCSSTGTGSQCIFAPATPSSGSLTYSTGSTFSPWPSGTTVTLTCPSGQFPQGTSTASCSNGQWTSLATSCSTNPSTAGCTPFSSLASSMSGGVAIYSPSPSANIQIGSSASLVCNSGFTPSGVTSATCTQFGWQPASLGICSQSGGTGISCSAQITPPFGSVTYSTGGSFGPFPTGTSSFLSCSSGYSISGSSTSTCTNGAWSPPFGTCIFGTSTGSQCFMGLTTSSGTVTYSNRQLFGPWNCGTTATLTCPSPSFLTSGSLSSTCMNGQWNPAQLGQCSSSTGGSSFSTCQAVPQIPSGTLTYSTFGFAPYNEGTTVTLVCQFGTQLSGLSTATCRNGGWTPFPGLGTCLSALRSPARFVSRLALNSTDGCPPPKAPPHGEITYSEPEDHGLYSQGTTAALRCQDGFGKRGASFSTCRSGMFRPLLGSCDSEAQSLLGVCLPLQTPINGWVNYIQASVTTSLEAGSTALLDCDDGYAISGRATLSCSVEGSWLPEDGFGQCDLTNR